MQPQLDEEQEKRMRQIAHTIHATLTEKRDIGDEGLTLYEYTWLRELDMLFGPQGKAATQQVESK